MKTVVNRHLPGLQMNKPEQAIKPDTSSDTDHGCVSDVSHDADALPDALPNALHIEVQWQTPGVEQCRKYCREYCPADNDIRRWARMAIESESKLPESAESPAGNSAEPAVAELTVRIVDSEEMRSANCQWRGIDKSTNVLSFPSDFPAGIGLTYFGDMLICAEVLAAESELQGKPLNAHWAHIVVHGTLHLLGYDHIDPSDAAVMERREIEILATLGIPNPYITVGEAEITPSGGQ